MKRYHVTTEGFTLAQFENLTERDRSEIGITDNMSLAQANQRYQEFVAEQEKTTKSTRKNVPVRDNRGHFIKKDK